MTPERELVEILNRLTAWELREFLKPDAAGHAPTLPIGFENRQRRMAEVAALTAAGLSNTHKNQPTIHKGRCPCRK